MRRDPVPPLVCRFGWHVHIFSCSILPVYHIKYPFLYCSSNFCFYFYVFSVCIYYASTIIGSCDNYLFVLFNEVLESLLRCSCATTNFGVSSTSFFSQHIGSVFGCKALCIAINSLDFFVPISLVFSLTIFTTEYLTMWLNH